jgi:hypothetical protein
MTDVPNIIQRIPTVTSRSRLDVRDLSFSMKLAKVGMIDPKQLGRFTAGQAAHDLLCVGREVSCTLRVKVRREKFRVMPDGNV